MKPKSFDRWFQEAKDRVWDTPGETPTRLAEVRAWVHFWSAMDEFESMERCGRPVPPQKKGGTK